MENNETNELNNKLEIYNRIKEKLQEIVRNKTNLKNRQKLTPDDRESTKIIHQA